MINEIKEIIKDIEQPLLLVNNKDVLKCLDLKWDCPHPNADLCISNLNIDNKRIEFFTSKDIDNSIYILDKSSMVIVDNNILEDYKNENEEYSFIANMSDEPLLK